MFSKIATATLFSGALGLSMTAAPAPAQAWCGYYGCGSRDAAIAAGVVGAVTVAAIAASAARPTRVVYVDRRARRRAAR